MKKELIEKKANLIKELESLKDSQWFSGYASHGIEQVNLAENKCDLYFQLLESKLSPTEIMYVRAKNAVENVVESIFFMTEKIIECLQAAAYIDVEYIDRHVNKIDKKKPKSEKELERIRNLVKRYHIWNRYLKSAEERLYTNEDGLTQLDLTVAKLSENEFTSNKTDDDMNEALENMIRLSEKFNQIAKKFSQTNQV